MEMKENVIKELTDRDHILLKPNMYCGSLNSSTNKLLILEDDKFKFKDTTYVGGLLKIIDEILDNSIDEYIRTNGQYAKDIDITIDKDCVEVRDNGRGVPQTLNENKIPSAVIAFTRARAGSNFSEDTKANGIGTNGVGSFLTNVMSKRFEVETNNGIHTLKLSCINNCETFDFKIKKKKSKTYTSVKFYPDFEKFEVDELTPVYEKIITNRLMHITQTYDINFKFNGIEFNGNVKKINPKKYASLYSDDIITFIDDKYIIGIYPNDSEDFRFTTYVNGLYMKRGGNHIDLISDQIVDIFRDKLSKKYKNIKPGDIKNKLSIVCIMSDFNNLQFDSQTKETVTNSNKEIKQYLDLDFSLHAKKILANKLIIENITEVYKIREELAKKKLLKDKDKTPKKLRDEKYMPAIKKNEYLVLLEGASAKNAITPILGRENFGYIELKGKPLNAYNKTALEVTKNKELNLIRNVLGIKASDLDSTDYNYKNILIATDADLDGLHISSLLFAFFSKFTNMFENGKIKILKTPIAVATKGKNKKLIMEYGSINNYDHTWNIDYKKGLGSWCEGSNGEVGELGQIFDELGIENFIQTVDVDDENLIKYWMDKDKEFILKRKEFLMNNEFSLEMI